LEDYKYILYLKKQCPFCVRAESFLSLKEINYKSVYFDQNLKILEDLKDAYGHSTVPMIFRKSESEYTFVGGYTELLDIWEHNEHKE